MLKEGTNAPLTSWEIPGLAWALVRDDPNVCLGIARALENQLGRQLEPWRMAGCGQS